MRTFRNIGYYIPEFVPVSDWMTGLTSKKLLTPSSCICDVHPDFDGCFWLNHKKDAANYQKRLQLSGEEFGFLNKWVCRLFEENLLAIDSRFVEYQTALAFYQRFFREQIDCVIIGVFAEERYVLALGEDFDRQANAPLCSENLAGEFIGHDIIGWDNTGFHTYLCNSLQKNMSGITYNAYGLMSNSYEEVQIMADQIQGKGEPVDWFPCKIHKYND